MKADGQLHKRTGLSINHALRLSAYQAHALHEHKAVSHHVMSGHNTAFGPLPHQCTHAVFVWLLCSGSLPQEASATIAPGPVRSKPSIQLLVQSATAQALAASLVECIIGSNTRQSTRTCEAGYQLLCQLASADVKASSERMNGIAQHMVTTTLEVSNSLPSIVLKLTASPCIIFSKEN